MKNLVDFFFSFDKLFKEKLVVPFFWLALIYFGLNFLVMFVDGVQLDPLNWIIAPLAGLALVLLTLISIRIVAELIIAIFRINDNLSPDKGRGELADIDPLAEARKAAELAASRTREVTKSATEKTRSTLDEMKHSVEDTAGNLSSKARSLTGAKPEPKVIDRDESALGVGSTPSPDDEPTPVKALEPSAIDKAAVVKRGRGRPKGSKNKPKTDTDSATTDAPVKRGRGRPKGSTNKPKAASSTSAAKRGPGRPKGSKNKTTTDAATSDTPASAKRGRGRPKGSKNKPKAASATTAEKRGPGRPKGSKSTTKSSGTKPGPKKGQPIPRDADGNLLKKDGTPRKKPGPKSK